MEIIVCVLEAGEFCCLDAYQCRHAQQCSPGTAAAMPQLPAVLLWCSPCLPLPPLPLPSCPCVQLTRSSTSWMGPR